MKKLFATLLTICLMFSSVTVPAFASTGEEDKAMGSAGYADSSISTMSVPSAPSNSIGKGVDISYHNWESKDVDFSKLAKSVDFVIIRCGYGQDYTSQDDVRFIKSVQQCEKYDIPYGVYLYSYATTTTKAKSEAAHTLRMMEEADADPSLPVFLDMEDDTQASVSASTKASIAKTYCNLIEEEGYTTGIYANKSWWTNYLTNSYFDDVIKWVAQYNSTCTYSGDYAIWQCSSTASVSGITGNVDLNYMIEDVYTTQSADVTATGYSGTYDGKSHSITVSNYKSGTSVQYSTDGSTYSTTKPTRKKVGTTTVYYKATNSKGKEVSGSAKIVISARKISTCTFSSISNKAYTGSQIKPSVTVKYGSTTLTKDTDYTVSYGTNKSTGAGTVTITGKGNFTGSKTITFYIVPKKVTGLKSSKGSVKKSAVLKWTKATGATGYQIAYKRYGSSSSYTTTTVTTNSKTFKGLNVSKYTVKVRAYKTVNGVKKYGAYSSTITMTAK